jgi:hypothetical protein
MKCRVSTTIFAMGTLAALLASCDVPGAESGDVESTPAPLAISSATGYVWAGAATGSYDADPAYSYNSSSAINHVTRLSTGSYRVDFPNLAAATPGGNVQVTAYGPGSERCKVESWTWNTSQAVQAFVLCFDSNGARVDTRFAVAYKRRRTDAADIGGYVRADQPTASSYMPDAFFQWSSAGIDATVSHGSSPGTYSVKFPSLGFSGGTVQVTAVGSGSERCNAVDWEQRDYQRLTVNCFDNAGRLVDSAFSLLIAKDTPNGPGSYGYVWADQPTTPSYVENSTRTRAFTYKEVGPVTVSRSSVGHYWVTFQGLGFSTTKPSHAQVSSYGGAGSACKVVGWSVTLGKVEVACFGPGGTPVDAPFTAAYSNLNVPRGF